MLMTLFDEQTQREEYNESLRKKSIEEGIEIGEKNGIEIGEKKGKIATLADLVKKGLLSLSQAATEAKMTEIEFENTPEMKNA